MLSVDAVVAGLGDKDRTHGSRNGLDDDAVAVDNEGMRGGYELPTRPAIERQRGEGKSLSDEMDISQKGLSPL